VPKSIANKPDLFKLFRNMTDPVFLSHSVYSVAVVADEGLLGFTSDHTPRYSVTVSTINCWDNFDCSDI